MYRDVMIKEFVVETYKAFCSFQFRDGCAENQKIDVLYITI